VLLIFLVFRVVFFALFFFVTCLVQNNAGVVVIVW
jgi:hypothetical protein